MSVRLSCPSCNTPFALPALPDHGRAQCPRCGDVFPIRTYSEQPDGAPDAAQPARDVHVPRLWPRYLAIGGAVAIVVAAIAVWQVWQVTRKVQPSDPPQPEVAFRAGAVAPGALVGLGYLPPECNVVVAVQPGPLLAEAARLKREPRDLLAQLGLPDQALAALDGTGVPLAQIDHVAFGAYLNDPGDTELRVALVLVLRAPLANEDEFRAKLKAKPVPRKADRWVVEVNKVPLSPVLLRASPTVWVFGLADKDFAAAEKGGGAQLGPGVRKMIDAVPPDAAVWLAADDERDWSKKPLLNLFAATQPDAKKLLPALSAGRGAMVALSYGEKPRLAVQVRTADTATADRVRAYFTARAAETEGAKTNAPSTTEARYEGPLDANLIRRALADLGR
jgi:hypothetical protein